MEIGQRNKASQTPCLLGDDIALCVIGRRENRYVREFVSHYKSLGFDKVFLCDNNRSGEERFYDVLRDYIEEGFVEVLNYRDRVCVQRESYEDVYRKYGDKYRWIAFFDFDEFLCIPCGNAQGTGANGDIHELMKSYEGFDCVLFNWMNYGDNGLIHDDGRTLAERFTEPLPFDHEAQYSGIPDNNHVKCIVHGGLPLVLFDDNPHLPSNKMRCCNSLCDPCSQKPFQKYNFSVAYLKHYVTKTVEEWFSNKWQKGTGNKDSIEGFRSMYSGRFFAYNEWTQEKDDVMRELTGLQPRIVPEHKTVVIVNFNTTRLTMAAIRSLNKQTPGCRIVVFDNSDKEAFIQDGNASCTVADTSCTVADTSGTVADASGTVADASGTVADASGTDAESHGIAETCGELEVIDNTKGQLIDFEAMLAEYPDKYPTPENSWGSAKHCKTIDYLLDLFPDGFLLMDSDVLVKKDISPFFDNSCAWVGNMDICRSKFSVNLPRVLPYICYINSKMCLENGIRYFNGEKMFALSHNMPDMAYDTGCWFYEACAEKNLPVNHLHISDYILHLHHGSWYASNAEEWLEVHRELWR